MSHFQAHKGTSEWAEIPSPGRRVAEYENAEGRSFASLVNR